MAGRFDEGTPDTVDDVHTREAAFHDALAARQAAEELPAPTAPDAWEAALLAAAAPLEGLDVLELGCGDGNLTLQLAGAGAARISALDISAGMVELARRRMAEFRPQAQATLLVAPAEELPFEDASFDLVIGKFLLHHVDLGRAAAEIDRVLRPGGRGVFIETSALNPVLAWSRRHLVGRFGVEQYGTDDEHPLGEADLELLRSTFAACRVDFPVFYLLQIANRNLFSFRHPRVTRASWRTDAWLARRLPAIRRFSYYLRVVVEKQSDARSTS